jgi:hypothetical protein
MNFGQKVKIFKSYTKLIFFFKKILKYAAIPATISLFLLHALFGKSVLKLQNQGKGKRQGKLAARKQLTVDLFGTELLTNTWLFYKRSFDCSNFKGTGLENNYYLLRPIYLNSGELVNSKRRFIIAQQQKQLFEGIDFIVSDQHDAITAAKLLYLPFLVGHEEEVAFLRKYNLVFI